MAVQAILFNRLVYKNTKDCRAWLSKHGYSPLKKVHITDKYYRYRIGRNFKNRRYATKEIDDGVMMVFMYKK